MKRTFLDEDKTTNTEENQKTYTVKDSSKITFIKLNKIISPEVQAFIDNNPPEAGQGSTRRIKF
jgi:hypothetical protein